MLCNSIWQSNTRFGCKNCQQQYEVIFTSIAVLCCLLITLYSSSLLRSPCSMSIFFSSLFCLPSKRLSNVVTAISFRQKWNKQHSQLLLIFFKKPQTRSLMLNTPSWVSSFLIAHQHRLPVGHLSSLSSRTKLQRLPAGDTLGHFIFR